MMTRDRFNVLAAQGYNHIPVYRQLFADLHSPVSIFARFERYPNAYLFESVQGGETWGRYSMVGLGTGQALSFRNGAFEGSHAPAGSDPFEIIENFHAHLKTPTSREIPELPLFSGGLVGYFGYDTVRYIEPRLAGKQPSSDPVGLPDIWLIPSEQLVVFDNLHDTMNLIVFANPADADAYDAAQARLDQMQALIESPLTLSSHEHAPPDFVSQTGQQKFEEQVQAVQEYIRAGDVMQVVPSQRMSTPFDGEALSVYRALRHLNPSPYLFLLKGVGVDNKPFSLVGSSPEILSRLEQGKITVRPIAGTRPRGRTPGEDRELEESLLNDHKEIAEHVMLIDLGRNDVGRVSRTGSVRVTERMAIERYSHVMHIVSNVEGELDPQYSAMDVFKATFPAGTLTGAPKIRAMEIIDELEPVKRGVFGGAVGYLGWHGEMDTAIAIRTAVIRDGQLHVQAGAGVVADSVPASEWNETCIKARAVIRAVELSSTGLKLD